MALRTAIRQSPVVTFAVLAAVLWVLLTIHRVVTAFDLSEGVGHYIGPEPTSGIIGVLVMTVFLALLVVVYGEVTEPEPTPDPWRPE